MNMKSIFTFLILFLSATYISSQSVRNIIDCSSTTDFSHIFETQDHAALVVDSTAYLMSFDGEVIVEKKVKDSRLWISDENHFYCKLHENWGFDSDSFRLIKYSDEFIELSTIHLTEDGYYMDMEIYNNELITLRYVSGNREMFLDKYDLNGNLLKSEIVPVNGSQLFLKVLDGGMIACSKASNQADKYLLYSNDLELISMSLSNTQIMPMSVYDYNSDQVLIGGAKDNDNTLFLYQSTKSGDIIKELDLEDNNFWVADIISTPDFIYVLTDNGISSKGKIHLVDPVDFSLLCTVTANESWGLTLPQNLIVYNNDVYFASGFVHKGEDKTSFTKYEADCAIEDFEINRCVDVLNTNENLSDLISTPKIYPNPTSESISISELNDNFCYKIYDIQQNFIFESCDPGPINVNSLIPGVYIINAYNHGSNENYFLKFIKQ